ncbi:MAG: T9SS type A sorting domain-containing protein [Candidatus Zhuqueibacterota bacterium]
MKTDVSMLRTILFSACLTAFFLAAKLTGADLASDRIYEPVVIRGDALKSFYDASIDQLYLYAYNENSHAWAMIPFQIDEMIFAEDPFKPGVTSAMQDFYSVPDDGLLDSRDELVFLIRDLGDAAPDSAWIPDQESKSHPRLELKVMSPSDPGDCRYGYLYRSASIGEEIPTPYSFAFDAESGCVSNRNYSVRLSNTTGLIEDIAIHPPLGNGRDIFDTQKLRFIGVLDFGYITIPIGKGNNPAANERDNIYLYNEFDPDNYHLWVTPKPVVRLVREVRQTIRFGEFVLDEIAFYVRTKFYPFSGAIAGGAKLNPEDLKKEFHTDEDIFVELDLLRQSWDFNEAASGMKFYNACNDGILIDGMPDSPVKTIDTPIKEWTLTSGNQGSMFAHVTFEDQSWLSTDLYFYDNRGGGQGDESFVQGGDTGDSVSFGDQGILFKNLDQDSVSLELGFTAYFLPGNLSKADGEQLAQNVENPVIVSSRASTFSTSVEQPNAETVPKNFELFQNYPNPFNSATKIAFHLPESGHVKLRIVDITGKVIKILTDEFLSAGKHEIVWYGTDSQFRQAASGIYFYQLNSGIFSSYKKLIFVQ